MMRRLHVLPYMLFGVLLGLSGCCKNRYAVRTKAHVLKQVQPFTLPNELGKRIAIGKPWQRATALVLIRGYW